MNNNLEPTVQIVQKSFFQTKKGMAVLALSLAIVIFSILSIGVLTFLPKKPAVKNAKIATLGSKTFEIEGDQANVIIQVRNSPIDPGTPCSLIRKSPEFFKAFE